MEGLNKFLVSIIILIGLPALCFSQTCGSIQNLTSTQQADLQVLYNNLQVALQTENFSNVDQINFDASTILDVQAGLPEELESYVNLNSQTTWLSLTEGLDLSRQHIDANSTTYSNLWKLAKGMKPNTNLPHSIPLRASAELAAGLLKIAAKETDITRKNNYTTWATRALDSLATMQLSSGAFPFPDLRTYNDPVFTTIIQNYLNALGADSVNVLQNGWIIDDSGTGEFKFDAGVIANAYYEAYILTGNEAYKTHCLAVATYLLNLKLNLNYNYNSFVSLGLTRGFQLSANTAYLDRAIVNVRYGIFPGQLPNGRWMDGHNAKSVYHNLIIANVAPLFQVINELDSDYALILNMQIKAIRNLLNYTKLCGAATGFEWLVSTKLAMNENLLPSSLNDSINKLIGNYIQQVNSSNDFLDASSLGMYFELLSLTSALNEQKKNQDPILYPNPVSSILHIDLPNEETQLSIYNMLGEELIQLSTQEDLLLSVDQLKQGVYLMKITHTQGTHLMKFEKN